MFDALERWGLRIMVAGWALLTASLLAGWSQVPGAALCGVGFLLVLLTWG